MIDVEGANEKLRDRAAGIVAEVAGCSSASRWRARRVRRQHPAAVLRLSLGLDPAQALERASKHATLRAALRNS